MKLADIDKLFDDAGGVRVVAALEVRESGVDPIGLRQINLDLMDNVAPGINNVTQHVRYYTFVAWAAWKASTQAAMEGVDDPQVIADLMERFEALYAWSHLLDGRPFRGATSLRQTIARTPEGQAFRFEGEVWEKYKRTRTNIMAPTEYGPSIKALRYLSLDEAIVTKQVMPAVMDFEARVQEVLSPHLLAVAPPSIKASEIESFATRLSVEDPSDVERAVFRLMFHEIGSDELASPAMRRRKGTIDYLIGVLKELGPSTQDDIRKRFVANRLPADIGGAVEHVTHSAIMLAYLQARQLQRLATEAMLLWTERVLTEESVGGAARSIPTEELVDRADAAAASLDDSYRASVTVGGYLASIVSMGGDTGWPESAAEPGTAVVDLMVSLREAQQKDPTQIPGLAARSFAVVKAVNDALKLTDLPQTSQRVIDGRPDRLPMSLMSTRLEAISERPRASMWAEIIQGWVIGQHVHWSAVRGGDGNQRLRIALEEAGWMRVRKRATGNFVPTADRLYTMLALGASCGLIQRTDDGRFGA
ncbi:hypothetical protein ELI54_08315 [Rhizobium ruizarguesonis]|uniref:hypothetical protein n=1 Tax=Rhizobium TaxID=379 RepID=UPI0010307838|nr:MULTISPECIES: hypothetical protein [Rhizobium]MBY3359343.1 hypothetical protein [Rhizobium laguerreae]TAT88213.1 hypothetical protein ELI54_08315 [Rhizobium ruizarguesonis]